MLTTFDDDEHLYPALDAGAQGFLGKDAPPEQLLDAIRRTAAGESPFSSEVLRRIVGAAVVAYRVGDAELPDPHWPASPTGSAKCRPWSVRGCPTRRSPRDCTWR